MGTHTRMKTTLDIADDLLLRAKKTAKQRGVTVRSLVETGLTMALKQPTAKTTVKPVTFRGKGRQPALASASWETIRDTIYPIH
jgi:hypothetical protein